MRIERKRTINEILNEKPLDNSDDPKDIKVIYLAKKNLGCHYIKSANDYKVPENQRINTEKKMKEIALHEKYLYTKVLKFNEQVIAMRNKKKVLVQRIHAVNDRINFINRELNLPSKSNELLRSIQSNDECSERREIVSVSDRIYYQKNLTYCQNNFLKVKLPKSQNRLEQSEKYKLNPTTYNRKIPIISQIIPILSNISTPVTMKEQHYKTLSQFQIEQSDENKILLKHEKKSLLKDKHRWIEAFDNSLYLLLKQRFSLASNIKANEIHLMTLIEELNLVEGFELKEAYLSKKLEKSKNDRKEVSYLCSTFHKNLLQHQPMRL